MTNFTEIKLDAEYASHVLNEIPLGHWIDKSVGGCGLSYLALKDNNNAIILMPRIKLIDNKLEQTDIYDNLFKVAKGVYRSDIDEYIEDCNTKGIPFKILITYNSFASGKLDNLLEENDCRIYVDESQFLISFAEQHMELVMELHNRLESNIQRVSMISAYPPNREYLPEYIQNMPAIKYTWSNQIKANAIICDTNKPYLALSKLLEPIITKGVNTINGITYTKAIVFLNSVSGINNLLIDLDAKEDIAYIVGDTVRNDSKLSQYAHKLEDCRNLPKITIGTSSMISGIDLYDEETLNIVVSTSTKDFTLFDKELDVPQAITRQRIRSNPHNDKFIFIVDKGDMDSRIDKLEQLYNDAVLELNQVVDNINTLRSLNKQVDSYSKHYVGYCYLDTKLDAYIANIPLLQARRYMFEQLFAQYKKGYNTLATNTSGYHTFESIKIVNPTFTDYASRFVSDQPFALSEIIQMLDEIHVPAWRDIIYYGLKTDKLLLNYKQAKDHYDSQTDYQSIARQIKEMFKVGEFYATADIKTQLQELYDNKGLNRKAKATDLNEFFDVQSKPKRIDGKVTKGFLILKSKVTIK